jgi:hypothetical protein
MMTKCESIDVAYRRACIAHGNTPIIKRITMHPDAFRILADECLGKLRLNWYSDGNGPHYMGISIRTAPIPSDLFIMQGRDSEVIYASYFAEESNDKISGPLGSAASTCWADKPFTQGKLP